MGVNMSKNEKNNTKYLYLIAIVAIVALVAMSFISRNTDINQNFAGNAFEYVKSSSSIVSGEGFILKADSYSLDGAVATVMTGGTELEASCNCDECTKEFKNIGEGFITFSCSGTCSDSTACTAVLSGSEISNLQSSKLTTIDDFYSEQKGLLLNLDDLSLEDRNLFDDMLNEVDLSHATELTFDSLMVPDSDGDLFVINNEKTTVSCGCADCTTKGSVSNNQIVFYCSGMCGDVGCGTMTPEVTTAEEKSDIK